MNAAVPTLVSYEDYVALEQDGDVKHEWHDGAVFAMSRGTPEHARLQARIVSVLTTALADCTLYGPDLMLFVEPAKLSTYADVTVVCGPLETMKVTKSGVSLGEACTNPTILVEVLSDSTERYDRGAKFEAYQKLRSFEEYVLVSQHERKIEVYRRGSEGGRWSVEVAERGAYVIIHGKKIAVDDVYG